MDRYEEVVKEICKIYVFGEKGSPQAFSVGRTFCLNTKMMVSFFPHRICLQMNYSQPPTAAIITGNIKAFVSAWPTKAGQLFFRF